MTTEKRPKGPRLHHAGYARILRRVYDGDATWHEVAAHLGVTRLETIRRLMRAFGILGLMHVSGWATPGPTKHSRCPIFSFGPGADVAWPGGASRRAPRVTPDAILFAQVVRELMAHEHNGTDLGVVLGIGQKCAMRHIRSLRAVKLAHISGHDVRLNGAGYPVYSWGPDEPDAKKPKPQSERAMSRRYATYATGRRAHAAMLHLTAGRLEAPSEQQEQSA